MLHCFDIKEQMVNTVGLVNKKIGVMFTCVAVTIALILSMLSNVRAEVTPANYEAGDKIIVKMGWDH